MKSVKEKKDNRKIAIYSRKSKYTGKGESTYNQIEACKRKIELTFEDANLEKDILIYEDEGFTGYNTNRPDFQKMLKDVRDNKLKAVVFYKLDRISRNVSDFSNLVIEFDNYNVSFLSATESLENVTPSGRAMMFMISVFAQLERDTIAERIRDNMIELAKTGRWLGGTTPTGFKSEQIENITIDGRKRRLYKLSPIKEEISVVKILFDKMRELKSQSKLETYTIQNDIKTKNGKVYTRWSLKNILTNPVYAMADRDTLEYFKQFDMEIYADEKEFDGTHGLMVYNKTEKKKNQIVKKDYSDWIVAIGKHEGIVSGKEWVKIQEIIDENSNMKYRKPSVSNCILSGVLHCAYCGSFMRAKLRKNLVVDEFGRRKFDYMCELKEKSRKQKCQCKNINGLETDDLVLEEIKKITTPTSNISKALKKMSSDIVNKEQRKSQEAKTLKSIISKNEKDIDLLLEKIKYIDVDLLDDLQNEIKKLKKINEELENQVEKLTNNYNEVKDKDTADLLLNVLNTYVESFDILDLNTKRNMIKMLVSSIATDGDSITINFIGSRKMKNGNFPTGDNCK